MSDVLKRFRLKDEVDKLHLVDKQTNQYNAIMALRCGSCKKRHPKSPAALIWWKCLKDKGQLVCPYCKSKNFIRTDTKTKSQSDLINEIIEKKTKRLKKLVEDEDGN